MTHRILHRKDERGVIVESGIFGPDDEVPEGFGAEGYTPMAESLLPQNPPVLIDNSEVTVGEVSSPATIDETIGQAPKEAVAGEVAESDLTGADEGAPKPPPQGGAGSGVEAWRAYAAEVDVEVAELATRDEIVAEIEKAGKPV